MCSSVVEYTDVYEHTWCLIQVYIYDNKKLPLWYSLRKANLTAFPSNKKYIAAI
jgi:hypothetical protein